MKAEDILKEAKETVAQNYKYKDWEDLQGHDWPEFFLDEVCLLAMSKVADPTWDASEKFTQFENTFGSGVPNDHPDKSTYMNNLFPKR